MAQVILPLDTNNTGKQIATQTVTRDGVQEHIQLIANADPATATMQSVTSAGVSGAAASAVQGITGGVPLTVTPSQNPAAGSGTLTSGAQTASGQSSALGCGQYRSMLCFANVSAVSGSGSITINLQTQDPFTSNWVTIGSWAAITAVTTNPLTQSFGIGSPNNADFGNNVRVSWTITGFTSVTFSVSYIGK